MTLAASTPTTLTPPVLEFCQRVVPGGEPEFVPVAESPDAEHLYCVPAVEKHVEEHGGGVQLGWQIRQWPGVLFEAIFHAVWRDPSGQLQDITPSPDKPTKTLFLPDARAKYEGRQINSIREPINNSPGGRLMIEAQNEEFELANRGERAHQHGELVLRGEEANEYRRIQQKKVRATQMIVASASAPRKMGRNDPCHCGSGIKFKRCHGAA